MKVELLRSIVAAGQARKVGDVVELSAHEFDFLAARGLVQLYNPKEPEPEPEPEPEKKKASSKKTKATDK